VFKKIGSEVGDKVRVEEVQDALRRLNETFNVRLESIE
jgi:hypothetical protein